MRDQEWAAAHMRRWVLAYRDHPAVVAWLKKNPPPVDWQGTAAQWAYTEMPEALLGEDAVT